ncbi:hypothetical protein PIB30_013022 [Stylosanthes scabra]|uniref:Uncharacterized protein n=1 Tax=Stylosanthes scabra TaxID=79078 RepID=A0ABU6R5Z1_9FABA|nr:hypothetical protein [Stylosanthes scabra]
MVFKKVQNVTAGEAVAEEKTLLLHRKCAAGAGTRPKSCATCGGNWSAAASTTAVVAFFFFQSVHRPQPSSRSVKRRLEYPLTTEDHRPQPEARFNHQATSFFFLQRESSNSPLVMEHEEEDVNATFDGREGRKRHK